VRHLFLDHSPITHLVLRRVVETERLPRDGVVVMRPPGVSLPDAGLAVRPALQLRQQRRPGRRRRLSGPAKVRLTDDYLQALCEGEPFHLYAPHLRKLETHLMASHPLCRGYSLIEEGLASYHTRREIDALEPPQRSGAWRRLRSGGRFGTRSFFGPGAHARAYGVSKDVFPDLERRVVLEGAFRDDLPEAREIGTLLATGGLARRGRVRPESVLSSLERALEQLQREGLVHLHWKPHRAQVGTAEEEALRALLERRGLAWERLHDALSLEDVAHSAPHIRVLVNASSTALYAAAAGCEVLSFARLVAEAEPSFARLVDALPRVWHARVRML